MPTPSIIEQTQTTWNGGNRESEQIVQAVVNDRLVFMSISGDSAVLEVILPKKNGVVARVLESDAHDMEVGKKYVMPVAYHDGWPKPIASGQVQLYRKPGEASAAVKPARTPRPVNGETKIAKCRAIFAANKGMSKAEVVALFISQAECTVQGANTYSVTCAKE